ncbi:MAG: glutathione S-transferase family protein [Kordiimonadaceae bacterium]|nr:glutathione S-transferase family protein [Kordiimonadaceae bacterium]
MTTPTLTLLNFPSMPGFYDFSPYCVKAELLLKMAELPYTTEQPENFMDLPKGKLPILKHDDTLLPDSEFIRLYIAENHSKTLDDGLSDEDKAIGHAVCRMLDERTMLALVHARWLIDEPWAMTKQLFFADAPNDVAESARVEVKNGLYGHGFGRHSLAEIQQLVASDIATLSTLLGEAPFFLNKTPTYLDATVFGMLVNFYRSPIPTWLSGEVAKHKNLVAYVERGVARWYPEAHMPAFAA